MDGFAIRFNENITQWDIIGEISAGHFKEIELEPNQAVLITTGSKIPNSCDTVIPVEDVSINHQRIELINNKSFKKGANIRLLGNDIRNNSLILSQNQLLSNKHIPILASCGKDKVLVFKPIHVSVISTGDELVDICEYPINDKIRCSNLYSLSGQAQNNHLKVNIEGIFNDNRNSLKSKFEQIIYSQSQIVISTGGVSVGKYDMIKDILEEIGCEILFWKANIKPGKPILVAKSKTNQIIFGLPGNPLSSFIGFEIFIKPLINKLFFNQNIQLVTTKLDNAINKKDSKMHFLLGKINFNESIISVSTKLSQNSGNLFDISKSNCLVFFNENENQKEKGDLVECIMI